MPDPMGQYSSPDPYGQYSSPYLGMGNNPVSMIDPDGGYSWAGAFLRWAGGGFSGSITGKSSTGEYGINYGQTSSYDSEGVYITNNIKYHDGVSNFVDSINPFESADLYVGGAIKAEYNYKVLKAVTPLGGGQLTYNTTKGGNASFVGVDQSYLNINKGNLDIRFYPAKLNSKNGIGGDYDPGMRMLYTVHSKAIVVEGVPIGQYKIQGDFQMSPSKTTVGVRGVAESWTFPSFRKGESGVKLELNAGIKLKLKVPDIFKN